MTPEIISNITSVAPVVGVLIYFILYFRSKEKEYKEEIKELNNHLKDTQVENLGLMKDFVNAIKDLTSEIKRI